MLYPFFYIYTHIYAHTYAHAFISSEKKFFCAGFFQRFFWLEIINRTIVPINPTKPLVLWDKTMLKDLIGNAFVGDI